MHDSIIAISICLSQFDLAKPASAVWMVPSPCDVIIHVLQSHFYDIYNRNSNDHYTFMVKNDLIKLLTAFGLEFSFARYE